MRLILVVVLILLLLGALPTWPYSTGWGYYPSGGLGLVLLIVLVLALTGPSVKGGRETQNRKDHDDHPSCEVRPRALRLYTARWREVLQSVLQRGWFERDGDRMRLWSSRLHKII
jgi:Protein of unknown function (DUF3309)